MFVYLLLYLFKVNICIVKKLADRLNMLWTIIMQKIKFQNTGVDNEVMLEISSSKNPSALRK